MSLDDEDEGGFERRGLDVSALSEIGGSVRGGDEGCGGLASDPVRGRRYSLA